MNRAYAVTVREPDGRTTRAFVVDAADVASAQLKAILRALTDARTCARCGGTILAPTRTGVPRGTCHCPR